MRPHLWLQHCHVVKPGAELRQTTSMLLSHRSHQIIVGQSNSTMVKSLALHTAALGLIPGTLNGPSSTIRSNEPGVTLELC